MIRLLAPRCDRATIGRMRDDGTDPEHGTHTRAGESRTIGFVLSPQALGARLVCRLMCRWFVNVPWLLRIDVLHM